MTDPATMNTTAAMLGAGALPPVTAGRASLLRLVDSPLLSDEPATVLDVWRAAFILAVGEDALIPITSAFRMADAAPAIAAESADAAVKIASQAAELLAEFDRCAIAHAQANLLHDPEVVERHLRAGIAAANSGFAAIPDTGSPAESAPTEKKKHRSALNRWLDCFERWLNHILR